MNNHIREPLQQIVDSLCPPVNGVGAAKVELASAKVRINCALFDLEAANRLCAKQAIRDAIQHLQQAERAL